MRCRAGMGSDLRMSGGEQHFKIGNQEELDSRREEMHRVLHSTSGMPHLEQTSSFRETISAAGDKKVGNHNLGIVVTSALTT